MSADIAVQAEQTVIGALLIDPVAFDRVADAGLQVEDFALPEHRIVFDAACRLVEARKPVDVITVWEVLRAEGKAEAVGGLVHMNALANAVASTANVSTHTRIVRQHADRRRLAALLRGAVEQLDAGASTVEQVAEQAQAALSGIGENRQASQAQIIGALLGTTLEAIERRAEGREPSGLRTGLHRLDRALNGMRAGQMIVCAGRPGMGKTALAVAVAVGAARDPNAHGAVLFLSLEMARGELVERAIAMTGGVAHDAILSGSLGNREWDGLTAAVQGLGDLPLLIDDQPGLTLTQVRAKAMRVKRERGLRLVVLDYLGLMRATGGENRTQQIGAISRGLKALAKEIGCPLLVLSQLNRANEARPNKRPLLSDLRDSGDIEQDADVAILLHRPAYYGDEPHIPEDLVEVHIAKQRAGRTGVVPLSFDAATVRMTDFVGTWPIEAPEPKKQGGFREYRGGRVAA